MNSFDILDALTDMEDDVLLRAESEPPRRSSVLRRTVRYAAAACMAVVLLVTALLATDTVALDSRPRWTVRYRESGVTYLFKGGTKYMDRTGIYVPTWLPEGYQITLDTWDYDAQPDTGSRSLVYGAPDDPRDSIWFSCDQIPYRGSMTFSDLTLGSYTLEQVDIGGIRGDLYIPNDEPDICTLVWLDTENSMMFVMHFPADDTEAALQMARSVTYVEQG